MYMNKIRALFTITTLLILITLVACGNREEAAKALVKEGKRLQSMGQNSEAARKFEEATKKDAENFEAWYLLGNSRLTAEKHREALEYFDKAILLNAQFAPAWYSRGLAWFYLDNQQKACENWKEAERLGYHNISDRTRHCR